MDFETIKRNAIFNINTLTSYTPFLIFYRDINSSDNNRIKLVGIIERGTILDKVDEYITKRKNKEGQKSHAIDLAPILTFQSEIKVNRSFHFVKAVCEHFNTTSKRVLFCNVFYYKSVSGKFCNFKNLFDKDVRKGNTQISLVEGDIPKRESGEDLRGFNLRHLTMERNVVNQQLHTSTTAFNNNNGLPIVAPTAAATATTTFNRFNQKTKSFVASHSTIVDNTATTNIIYISSDDEDNNEDDDDTNADSLTSTVEKIIAKRSALNEIRKQKKTKIRKVRNVIKNHFKHEDDNLLNNLSNNNANNANNINYNSYSKVAATIAAPLTDFSSVFEMTTAQLIFYLKSVKDGNRLLRVDEEQFDLIVNFLHKEHVDGEVFLGLTTDKLITYAKFTLGSAEKVDAFIKKLNQQ
ncbi:hypothetical protein ABK040_012182 [Willaertia magna]